MLGVSINPFTLPYVDLDDKTELPAKPGLYFVIDDRKLLYIGRSKNINQRWKSHHRYKQIKVISKNPQIAFLDVDDEELLWVERDVINRFNPILNDTKVEQIYEPAKQTCHIRKGRKDLNNRKITDERNPSKSDRIRVRFSKIIEGAEKSMLLDLENYSNNLCLRIEHIKRQISESTEDYLDLRNLKCWLKELGFSENQIKFSVRDRDVLIAYAISQKSKKLNPAFTQWHNQVQNKWPLVDFYNV